jgi:hypothetical protein
MGEQSRKKGRVVEEGGIEERGRGWREKKVRRGS